MAKVKNGVKLLLTVMEATRASTHAIDITFIRAYGAKYSLLMKYPKLLIILVSSFLLSGTATVFADEASDARAATVASIQSKYNPGFDALNVRLMAVQVKALNDVGTTKALKVLIKEFLGMRKTIDASLANSTSDLDTVLGFAEEELGEYDFFIYQVEQQLIKSKTIICVKGKTLKKVMALKPVCPKGYLKK